LLLKGHHEEALNICRQIAVWNNKRPEDVGVGPGAKVTLNNETTPLQGDSEKREERSCYIVAMQMFGPLLWRTTLASLLLVGCLGWAGYITTTLMPSFLVMKGLPKLDVYFSMLMSSLSQFPGVIFAWLLGTRYGRLLPFPICLVCVAVALGCFATASNQGVVIFWSCVMSCGLEFAWALYHTYLPEVYPTELRATALGFLTALGSCMSMGVPMISAWLVDTRGHECVVIVVAVVCCFTAVATWLLFNIETMDRDLADRAVQLSKAETEGTGTFSASSSSR